MSIKLGYPINAKSQRFLQYVTFWIRTRTEMTILNVIEKRQKSPFLPSALLQKSSLQKPKACHRSQSLFKLGSDFFVLIRFPGRSLWYSASWPCLDFQHHDCIARWEKARIFDGVPSSLHFFFIFMQILRPSTEISRLLWFSLVANSKIWSVWARNSLVVESQSYFVSERPF